DQRDRQQPRQRQRQRDAPERAQPAGPVDHRRFLKVYWNRAEVADHHPCRKRQQEGRIRRNQRAIGIDEAQIGQSLVQRDKQHRPRQQIGNQQEGREYPRAQKLQPRQRIGRQSCQRDRNDCAAYRHNKRIAEPGQERRVLKQSRILIERPGLRPEDRSALKYLRRTLERGDKHPVEREQDKEQNRDQQQHTQHQIHALSFRLLEQRLFFPGVDCLRQLFGQALQTL